MKSNECVGIDEAIQIISDASKMYEIPKADLIINRLDYHRAQAEGRKPKYMPGAVLKDYYTCGNCRYRVQIQDNYCPSCGFKIKWDSTRCLTGLPLADMAEKGN